MLSLTGRAPRRRRAAAVAAVVVALLLTSACGSRRDAQEFVVAARAPGAGVGAPAADPAAAPSGALPGGALPSAPGAPAPGSPAPDAPSVAGGQPRASTGDAAAAAAGAASPRETGKKPSAGNGDASAATNDIAPAGGKAPASDPCAISGSAIVLGNISTQSGLLGELFKGLPEALQVWAKSANACGGLGGHPVEVISGDDGGDPATGQTLAQRMVENDKVLAFIGLAAPLSVTGFEKYLAEVGVPSIGGVSSELPYFTNPMFFPIGPFVSVIGAADAAIAINKGAEKLAVFHCAELPNSCGPAAASKDLQVGSEVVRAMGGEVVISQKTSLVAPSYTSQCIAAKRAGAEAIIAILDGPSVGRMATNCHAQDYKPIFLGISTGIGPNLLNYPALNEGNFFAPLNTFPWMDTSVPATRAYAEAMQKYFGRLLPGPSAAMGYASGVLAAKAVAAGLPANPTPADMVKGLYTIKNERLDGLVAPLSFTPQVPRDGVTSCYFLIAISDGRYVAPEKNTCLPVKAEGPQ